MIRLWRAGGIAFALWGASAGASLAAVEYVKTCDQFGARYFYQPGSETCINADTGETRRDVGNEVTLRGKTAVGRQADDVGSSIDWLDTELDDMREGIAATAALPRPFIEPGHNYAVSGDWGQYDGSHAVGFGAAIRISDQVRMSASVGVGLESGVIATGLSLTFGW